MHAENASDPRKGRYAGVNLPSLDLLIGSATDTGSQEHRLLSTVLTQTFNTDSVTDGALLFNEPGVTVGQVGHP